MTILWSGILWAAAVPTPGNFTAAAESLNLVHLSWAPLTIPLEGYKIYRGEQEVGTTKTNVFDDKVKLKSGEGQCYTVLAVNEEKEESEPSRQVCTMIFVGELAEEKFETLKIALPGDSQVKFVVRADEDLSVGNWLGLIVLYDGDGITKVAEWAGPDGWKLGKKALGPIALQAGQYFLHIEGQAGKGLYTVTVSYTVQLFKNDSEPNDGFSQAAPVPLNQSFSGHLGYVGGGSAQVDQQDWWQFTLPSVRDVRFVVTAESGLQVGGYFQLTNQLVDKDGVTVLTSWVGPDGKDELTKKIGPLRMGAGTYYLRLFRKKGYGGYKALIRVTYPYR